MKYKCGYCDSPKENKKSIDTETDIYLKDKGRYYHRDCYIEKISNSKSNKLTENEIIEKADALVNEVKNKEQELKDKDNFYQWIMEFYDTALPSYYCIKIAKIRSGDYEGVPEQIDYKTLLDIYKRMKGYLIKVSSNKSFKNIGQRMNYDLAIVLGNYGDYKRYIEKKKAEKEDNVKINSAIKDSLEIKKVKEKEDDSFNLLDDIDELLI